MEQMKDVYKLEQELSRLNMQNQFLKELEEPVYSQVLDGMENAAVLDIGCNDGKKTADRFDRDCVSKVIGIEYHKTLVAAANQTYGRNKFHFYQADIESARFEEMLSHIMKASHVDGFDVINISFVLMHLKKPKLVLAAIKKFLKPEGTLVLIETEDRYSRMVPDDDGRMELFLKICDKDILSGNRHMGSKIPTMLQSLGYQDIIVHRNAICASKMEKDRKEQMFEIAFSYIPEDIESLCQLYPGEQKYLLMKSQVEENYEKFRFDFVEKASEAACGMVIVTCSQRPKSAYKDKLFHTAARSDGMEGKIDEET